MVSENKNEKIVVCITAQSNSIRLIDKASEVADKYNGELHILHVLQGNNVFNNEKTLDLLNELYVYGGGKGGVIHAFCNDDVCGSISEFVRNECITKIVLGEPPINPTQTESFFDKIVKNIPQNVDIVIVEKENKW